MIIPIIPITLPSAPKGLQVTLSLRLGGPGGGPWPLLATPPAGAEPLAGFWSAGGGLAGACTCTHHGLSSAPPVWWLVTCAGGAGAWLTVPALCSLPCLPGAGGWPSPAHEGRYIVVHCDSTQGGRAWAVQRAGDCLQNFISSISAQTVSPVRTEDAPNARLEFDFL